jgi:DHA1 family bicyclomycin/chloramphenicol resistance-like MFS transporter
MMSLLVSSLAISTLLAPLIGSWLVEFFGWKAPFASSLLFGVIILILMLLFIPESKTSMRTETSAVEQLFSSVKLFFSIRECVVGSLLISFLFFGYMSFLASFTSILVDVYAIPVVYLGLIFSFPVLAYLLGSRLSRSAVSRWGVSGVLKLSMSLLIVEFFVLLSILFLGNILLSSLCILLLPFFLVLGLLQPSASMLALNPMGELAGVASSILGTMQILSGALGALLAASLYQENINSMLLVMFLAVLGLLTVYYLGYRKLVGNVTNEST